MNQPLGRFAGNSLEVFECVEIMKNKTFMSAEGIDLYADTRELSLQLSAQMIHLSGKTKSVEVAYELANEMLLSGKAFQVFEKMCNAQAGRLSELPKSKQKLEIKTATSGYLQSFNVEKIGLAGILLHAGRMKNDDVICPTAGIEFHCKIGDKLAAGDKVFTIHGDEPQLFTEAAELLSHTYEISLQKPEAHDLISAILH
jgi:pyrimidine-nucleoside phosphorylase